MKPLAPDLKRRVRVTDSAVRLAQFVERYTREHRGAPTFREIRAEFGYAGNASITHLLGQLERAGIAERVRGPNGGRKDRSIRIVPPIAPMNRHSAELRP